MAYRPFITNILGLDGSAESGGLLYSYVKDTSTPLALYTDAGVTPDTNPSVADALGQITVYFNDASSYSWTAKTADAATTLWEADVVSGALTLTYINPAYEVFPLIEASWAEALATPLGDGWPAAFAGTKIDRTFSTRTAAAAATISSTTQWIAVLGYATIFDGGAANYKRIATPSPVKAWQFASADGAYWQADFTGGIEARPEVLGAVGDGTAGAGGSGTDDTDAFQDFADMLEAKDDLGITRAGLRPDAIYWVLPDGLSTQTYLMHLQSVRGLVFNGNGALISCRIAETGKVHTAMRFDASHDNVVRGIRFEQPNLAKADDQGVRFLYNVNGCTDNDYQIEAIGGGIMAVGFSRTIGGGAARSSGNKVHVRATDCYYGLSLAGDGDDTTGSVITDDCGRSLIFYNNRGVKVLVDSKNNNTNNDLLINAYGHTSTAALDVLHTTDFDITYLNRKSTQFTNSTPIAITHQQNDASSDVATRIQGCIRLGMSTNGSASGHWQTLIENESYIWDTPGSTQQLGEPSGGNLEEILIEGIFEGNLAGSINSIDLGSSSNGFSTASTLRWGFHHFQASSLARPVNLGRVTRFTAYEVNAPSAAITLEASFPVGNLFHLGSRFSGISSLTGFNNSSPLYIYYPTDDSARILELDGNGLYHGMGLRTSGTLRFRLIADGAATYFRGEQNLVFGADAADLMTLDTGTLFPNTTNGLDLGKTGNLWKNLELDGVVKVDNTQVVGAQQSAIADLAWTYTANDPGTTPNSATTFADGTALVAATVYEALDEIEGKINAILAALRTHGLIDT